MNLLRMKATLMASLLGLFCLSPAWAQSGTTDADSAAIKQTISAWASAWNSKDAHGCAMQFTEDGDFVSTGNGSVSHGRKAVETHYGRVFQADLKNAQRTDTVKGIRFLSPDVALANITFEMDGATEKPVRKGLVEPVLVKQNGQWLIASFVEADFKDAPAK